MLGRGAEPPPHTHTLTQTHTHEHTCTHRWFRLRADEGRVPRAVYGDHHAMLGELLRRRREEPEGSDEALREAGVCMLVDCA